MKKTFINKLMSGAMVLMFASAMSSCEGLADAVFGSEDNPSNNSSTTTVAGIPSDSKAEKNPTLPEEPNATMPNVSYSVKTVSGQSVIKFNMTGIFNPNETSEWLKLYGTGKKNQNVWVEIDGKAKGIKVQNTIDEEEQVSAVDLVFLVDNSGSMGEEADAVARDIKDWAKDLEKTLDMKFACVGYDEGYISGAFDFDTADKLSAWLDQSTGTYRTHGFVSPKGTDLQSLAANGYRVGSWHENGVTALRMADENFDFRTGANRVYVNFTDEPNQPDGNPDWSTDWVKNPDNWPTTKGAIHTVFSDNTWYPENYNWTPLYEEDPRLLSDYTGGTKINTDASFAGVTLSDLPITGALQNSYIISVTNVEKLFDGKKHTVKITILSPNGKVRAERTYTIKFKKK